MRKEVVRTFRFVCRACGRQFESSLLQDPDVPQDIATVECPHCHEANLYPKPIEPREIRI